MITDAIFVGESSFERPKPLTIFIDDDPVSETNMMMLQPKLIVEAPSLFPYINNKMVPWNYNCNYANESAMTNISSIRGMT